MAQSDSNSLRSNSKDSSCRFAQMLLQGIQSEFRHRIPITMFPIIATSAKSSFALFTLKTSITGVNSWMNHVHRFSLINDI